LGVEGGCHGNEISTRFTAASQSQWQAASIEAEHLAALHDIVAERAGQFARDC
jgi:hypothetical protein